LKNIGAVYNLNVGGNIQNIFFYSTVLLEECSVVFSSFSQSML